MRDDDHQSTDSQTQEWLHWTYEECTLLLKRYPKMPQATLRLASILCSDLNRPDEAQSKLNDVVRSDRDFEVAKVQEVQGDIFLKLD